jgi:hypothetical protein
MVQGQDFFSGQSYIMLLQTAMEKRLLRRPKKKTFLPTLYRIKIERDQIHTFKENVNATQCLLIFSK